MTWRIQQLDPVTLSLPVRPPLDHENVTSFREKYSIVRPRTHG